MTVEFHMAKQNVCKMAAGHGWTHLKTQEWCMNFEKMVGPDRLVVNVFWDKKVALGLSETQFTVQTAMRHPKKGKTQLNRKFVGMRMLNKIFENPRHHSGKGYY
jgi:hypothetical protein